MMEFRELTREEFALFSKSHQEESFMQTVELGDLRKAEGFDVYYLGVIESGKILCASFFCADKVFMGKKVFYAPRGFLIDWHNKELLSFFTTNIKKFAQKRGGMKVIMDPNHVYRQRAKDGSFIEGQDADKEAFQNIVSLGWRHFGFNLYLESRQVRWAYRMNLDESYDIKKNNFSKSTRKNLEKAYSRGLIVRKGTANDLDIMENLFKSTAVRKDFYYRETEYYRQMYQYMSNLMEIYIAHLDAERYVACASENLEEEKKMNASIIEEMKHEKVGAKLLKKKDTSDRRLIRLQEDLNQAIQFKKENPDGKDVAALLSLKSGEEFLTLNSGSLEEYRSFTPKYALYDAHIKDAYKMGFKACNFYGISGNFEKENNIFYGVYEFKRGFGGNVIEYIGEFEMCVSWVGNLYNSLRNVAHKIHKTK